jgi:NSS family neurotransmitter:Na+ symporter
MDQFENVTTNERESFSGKLGFVLACVGSAIGLGNIWMFSWRLGQFGGGAFLVPYIIFVFTLGTTGLMSEFSLGRVMQMGSLGGIKRIFAEKRLPLGTLVGSLPTLAVSGILIFYVIVVGWVLRYFFSSLGNAFVHVESMPDYFQGFAGTWQSVPWHFVAMAVTVGIVILGVSKGIEKINKIIMPALFVIFLILLVRSLTLPGAMEGVKYLLVPDWSHLLKPITWIMALGQAFFTVSLNGAGMVVYGSYLKQDMDIPSSAMHTALFDTMAAMLAAFIIIPAAFAFGLDPAAGPELLFITIPKIFTQMPGGYLFSVMFFASIIFAAVSSAINMLEAPSEALMVQFKLNRTKAVLLTGSVAFAIGIPLATSMARFGAFADFITIYIAPLGAIIATVAYFWIYGTDRALDDINIGAKRPLGEWFKPFVKYVFTGVCVAVLVLGAILGGIG